ncbi:MAG: ATP-dependent zinc protease [Desulfatiglandales bacterium]
MLFKNHKMFPAVLAACAVSLLMGAGHLLGADPVEKEKAVIGRVERVRITPGGLTLRAKIDTAADNSSVHVEGIEAFERDSDEWVRFRIVDKEGNTVQLERKILRVTRVKQKNRNSERRYVVELGLCLGDVYKDVPVNLVDRDKFKQNLLVGRSFLRGSFIVDPEITLTREPACR